MDWIQATIRTTTEGAEVVLGMLMELGLNGAMIEDRKDVFFNQRPAGQWDIIDEDIARRMEEDVKVSAYFAADERAQHTIEAIRAQLQEIAQMDLGLDLGKMELSTQRIDEEDWASAWKVDYKPFRLGRHFVVRPTWCEYEIQPGDKVLDIDPGMAFGSGTHETTALCVGLVEEYVHPGDRVIDVGTGSGILALAAAMMDAGDVLGIDLDPVAVRVAAENASINGMDGRVRMREGDLLKAVDEVADVVVANIIADVIVSLARPVMAHIVSGGWFICSGIARERKGEVIDALESAGYCSLDVRDKGEWTAIAARRP